MRQTDHAFAALEALTVADLDALPPAHLQRFSELCRHWHQLADRRARGEARPRAQRAGYQPSTGHRAPPNPPNQGSAGKRACTVAARCGEHATFSHEGRHDCAPGTLNALYLPAAND